MTATTSRFPARRWRATLLGAALLAPGLALAATCHVNHAAGAGGDGGSWASAYTDLQDALANTGCTEIWIAQGTYKPTSGTDRTISFDVPAGVAIYGGFAGTEASRDQRDPVANITTLSGDIGAAGDASDNSGHVVFMDGGFAPITTDNTVLDGLTITAGNADFGLGHGGGLYCQATINASSQCSPTIANVIFSGNSAWWGGAMSNSAANGGTSSPRLANVTFSGNSAENGGAIFNNAQAGSTSSPGLTNVTFSDNEAELGGAMHNWAYGDGTSSPVLLDVTFSNNSALSGGAIDSSTIGGISSPRLTNVTFSGNSAENGGAMHNIASDGGSSSPWLTNVTFSGNNATRTGGAMRNRASSGGISFPVLSNVILWGNGGASGGVENNTDGGAGSNAGISIAYSIVEGGCPATADFACSNVIDADPLLGPLADNGGLTLTLLPGAGSPAIDAGTSQGAPGIDQRGVSRPQGAGFDIGAVEVVQGDGPGAGIAPIPTLGQWALMLMGLLLAALGARRLRGRAFGRLS